MAVVVGVAALLQLRGPADDAPRSGSEPQEYRPEFGPLPITAAVLFSDTELWLGSYCGIDRFGWEVVESSPQTLRIRMEGLPSMALCGGFEAVELTEPVAGRLVVDDVSGEVVWDSRVWQGMPLLAVDDRRWDLVGVAFPPDLADPPAPLDPLRWVLTYERDGVEVVVESYTDTAGEVSATLQDPDDVVVDTAPGWAVRIHSEEPAAAAEVAALLQELERDDWLAAVGERWGRR